ncbi:MAG: UDP-N-acetylmuramoyl-tripeptide--D-alanyl-D-alanine ligase [Bacteroidales bacterium]|nr:UDP-N-acetylmuramoyl-tripeptide--D-alanyl-D-alanine ligase [Bacteroidales bacterium]
MHKTSSEELFARYRQHPYISTDSRIAQPGSLFFALKGDNFDGNQYSRNALENGAAFAVIDDPAFYIDARTLLVDDVLGALQQLASDFRSTLRIPVIGITGTNGKTTTKELMAAALSARFVTHATTGNLNNHIGVPITLLTIKPDTEIAVIEMGANHIGEIEALCRIARPTHGLITNIGKAHLEGFGSAEGVVKAKSELYRHLRNFGGTVFVNADNALLMSLTQDMMRITYGSDKNAGFRGTVIPEGPLLEFTIHTPVEQNISTKLAGSYNFENAMAALCIARQFRVNLPEAVEAIENYEPRMNRSQVINTERNTLIMDAYNANPSSMQAAIKNFSGMKAGYKILLLGDMFELGTEAPAEHLNILETAISQNFDAIITAGPCFAEAARGKSAVIAFLTVAELKEHLYKHQIKDATILIKGSRGMKLESVTENL